MVDVEVAECLLVALCGQLLPIQSSHHELGEVDLTGSVRVNDLHKEGSLLSACGPCQCFLQFCGADHSVMVVVEILKDLLDSLLLLRIEHLAHDEGVNDCLETIVELERLQVTHQLLLCLLLLLLGHWRDQ